MNFVNFLRTFASTGGDLIQFNIINNEILLDAQKHPEHTDLLVRVATYSAYFVELSPEVSRRSSTARPSEGSENSGCFSSECPNKEKEGALHAAPSGFWL